MDSLVLSKKKLQGVRSKLMRAIREVTSKGRVIRPHVWGIRTVQDASNTLRFDAKNQCCPIGALIHGQKPVSGRCSDARVLTAMRILDVSEEWVRHFIHDVVDEQENAPTQTKALVNDLLAYAGEQRKAFLKCLPGP